MTVQEWLGADNKIGIDIWEKKYRNNNESFDEWLDRVSGHDPEVRKLIEEKKFLFGGRILAGRGVYEKSGDKLCYSNCFVAAPPEDNLESIFDTAKKMARTYSYGGGVGVDISKLAPTGARVHNAAKESSGAVSFMDLYSTVTGLIGQAGRRGALMISMSCDHPDIEQFIDIKKDLNRVTKANISVRATDEFMDAVIDDEPFELKFTREETCETISRTVNAKDLLMKIAQNNWETGEPGMLFWDTIEEENMLSGYDDFEFAGVNPCFGGDMELLTTDGYKCFKDLDGQEVDIYNVNGNVVKSKVWCSGEKETVKIKLGTREIVCTPEHRFLTVDGEQCMAKDLKGKYLMPCTNSNKVFDPFYVKIGFIQGDGQLCRLDSEYHKGIEVNIGAKDVEIRDLFLDDVFTEKSDRAIYLEGFRDSLIELGFSPKNLPERIFPDTYNSWTKLQKASFLHGCYSANGSVIKSGRVSYKTTCREFADQLVNTLRDDFQIYTYITTNKAHENKFSNGVYMCRESYDVNIVRHKDITKFAAEINFYQQYKREQLAQMIKSRAPYVYNVEPNGIQKVYDFTEPERHWGIVEGCVVHNCAEEPLGAWSSCLLGSINLSEFVKDANGKPEFDYEDFEKTVRITTRALNDVLDEGMDLLPLPEQKEAAQQWRQIGLGIFGLADMLIKLGIRYGSQEAINISDRIGDLMLRTAFDTSCNDGRCFPRFDSDKTHKSQFVFDNWLGTDSDLDETYIPRMANSQLLTIAPTGTLSTMLGVSGGIEPIFANSYERRTESLHGKEVYYKVYTPIVKEYMDAHGITDEADLPDYFVTAHDIDWHERIAMQAAWQQHIDASISSTINLPHDATPEDIFNIYVEAWQAGLKGVTVFRDGCSRQAILSERPEHSEPEKPKGRDAIPWGTVIEVNDDVIGKKRKLMTGCGSLHCVALFDPVNGNLLETYLSKGSNGGCQNFMIGLSRMISLAARAGVGIDNIIDQLESCGVCPSYAVRHATKHDTSSGSCCPVAVGRALKEMWEEMQEDLGNSPSDTDIKCDFDEPEEHDDTGPKCPECGAPLIFEGGCNICKNCGWSKCS